MDNNILENIKKNQLKQTKNLADDTKRKLNKVINMLAESKPDYTIFIIEVCGKYTLYQKHLPNDKDTALSGIISDRKLYTLLGDIENSL